VSGRAVYTYVGNDPLDKTDPNGDLSEGTGFTNDQWKKFNAWQQRTAKSMDSKASKLNQKADKLDANGKSGADVLRTEAKNLSAGAAALRDTSSAAPVANLVADKDWSTVHPGGSSGAQAFTPDSHTIYFRNSDRGVFGAHASASPQWEIGHESIHVATGQRDQIGPNGFPAYKYGSPAMVESFKALIGTPAGANNPDNLMGLVYGNN